MSPFWLFFMVAMISGVCNASPIMIGNLDIGHANLLSVSSLERIEELHGDLKVHGIQDSAINGLHNLKVIRGDIEIVDCPNLAELRLTALHEWNGNILITGSPSFRLQSFYDDLDNNRPKPPPRTTSLDEATFSHAAVMEQNGDTIGIAVMYPERVFRFQGYYWEGKRGHRDMRMNDETASWDIPYQRTKMTSHNILQRSYYQWVNLDTRVVYIGYVIKEGNMEPYMNGVTLPAPSFPAGLRIVDSVAANFLSRTIFTRVDLIVDENDNFAVAIDGHFDVFYGKRDAQTQLGVTYFSGDPRDADRVHLVIFTEKLIQIMGAEPAMLNANLYTIQVMEAAPTQFFHGFSRVRRPNAPDLLTVLATDDGNRMSMLEYEYTRKTLAEPKLVDSGRVDVNYLPELFGCLTFVAVYRNREYVGALVKTFRNPEQDHRLAYYKRGNWADKEITNWFPNAGRLSEYVEVLPNGRGVRYHATLNSDRIPYPTSVYTHSFLLNDEGEVTEDAWDLTHHWREMSFAAAEPFPEYSIRKTAYDVVRLASLIAYIEPPPTQWNPFAVAMNQMAPLAGVSLTKTTEDANIFTSTYSDFFALTAKARGSLGVPGVSINANVEGMLRQKVETSNKREFKMTRQDGFTASNIPMVFARTLVYRKTSFDLWDDIGEQCGTVIHFDPLDTNQGGDIVIEAALAGVYLDFVPGNMLSHSQRLPPPGVEDMLGEQHRRHCVIGSEYHMEWSMEKMIEDGKKTTSEHRIGGGVGGNAMAIVSGITGGMVLDLALEGGTETGVVAVHSAQEGMRISIDAGKIESGPFEYMLIPSLYSVDGVLRLTWKVEVDKYKAWWSIYGNYADPILRLPFGRPDENKLAYPLMYYTQDIRLEKLEQADEYDVEVTLENASFAGTDTIVVELLLRHISPSLFHLPPWSSDSRLDHLYYHKVGERIVQDLDPLEERRVFFDAVYIPKPSPASRIATHAQIIAVLHPYPESPPFAFPTLNKWAYISIPSIISDV